jgi:hypothetical protein
VKVEVIAGTELDVGVGIWVDSGIGLGCGVDTSTGDAATLVAADAGVVIIVDVTGLLGKTKLAIINREINRTKRHPAIRTGPKAENVRADTFAGSDTFRRSLPIPLFLLTKIPVPMSLRP